MIGHRQLSMDDYLVILRRRWWLILVPAFVGCAGAYLFSRTLTNQYTSHTVVLVAEQEVPDSYVKSVVTGDIGQRLGTLQEQILSRSRLQPIIEKFGLFSNDKGKVAMEDLVDRLRQDITIAPVQSVISTKEGELPGFSIGFTANDPRLAQQICAEITSMFIAENLHLREQSAEGTTDFLKTEVEEAKASLDAQDAKLADFKRRYIGALPGSEQADMSLLASLNSQLDAVMSQLTRAQQDKGYQESLLAQQLSEWEISQKTGGLREDTLAQQLTNLQGELVTLQSRYTADHPEVVKLKQEIAALKKRMADNAAHGNDKTVQSPEMSNPTEPASIQQLRFQIHQSEAFIAEKTREEARLKQQLNANQARLSMSPGIEQQYKELTRGYQAALQFYNELLTKRSQSEMATSLERRQQGEQFRVMDSASLPEKPSYPNRPVFAGGGLGAGLALGLGITLLIEMRDKSLVTESDVEHFLGLPTLATVPLIGNRNGEKEYRARSNKKEEAKHSQTAEA